MRLTNSFSLSLLGLIMLGVMAWRGTDTAGNIVALISAYIASRAAQKATYVVAAAKDNEADTREIIKDIEENKR